MGAARRSSHPSDVPQSLLGLFANQKVPDQATSPKALLSGLLEVRLEQSIVVSRSDPVDLNR